ncbi:MAG: hypothetical protein JSW03_03710 [Candidatus Eiseniibacteriota bacterium]|nr:MAG: hypothetical protein JSW03_03710 [Candidatus Eisenbacteria bacterium]
MARFGVCIFEDRGFAGFEPLVYTRAVFELRCGILSLWEKMVRDYEEEVELFCLVRPHLAETLRGRLPFSVNELDSFSGETMLFVNGRLLAPPALSQLLPLEGKPARFVSDGELIAFRVDGAEACDKYADPRFFLEARSTDSVAADLPATEVKATLVEFTWELVFNNPGQIGVDFDDSRQGGKIEGEVDERTVVYNSGAVHVSPGARVDAGVVIDARGGPVFIGTDARVSSFTRIEGPCSIGDGTFLVGGRITGGCSFGPCCRIGGEVEQSIIQGYSNKYHEGFVGHSYIGEWVNLGALTTNSDLKNTYRNVSVPVDGRPVDTKMLKVGSFIGDFTKTGIGTLLDTGSVVGFSTNIFGGKGVFPKYLPSFMWGDGEDFKVYILEQAVSAARLAMERRDVATSPELEELFRKTFELTEKDRRKLLSD